MLDVKADRRTLIEALRPPAGYSIGTCIGTTFGLDLDVLTAILFALVGSEIEGQEKDPGAQFRAIARLRSRVRVYANNGGIKLPPSPGRFYALLDSMVRVRHVEHGSFHPKVWAMRFDPVTARRTTFRASIHRVFVASMNATKAGFWELGAVLEAAGTADNSMRPADKAFAQEVASFLEEVIAQDDVPNSLTELPREIRKAAFDLPGDGVGFLWQRPGKHGKRARLLDTLPKKAKRAFVLSPFVRSDFLLDISVRFDRITLLSTQRELDALPEETLEVLAEKDVKIFASTEAGGPLHAKLIAWESESDRATLVGSANATGPAWGCRRSVNWEAMAVFRPGFELGALHRSLVAESNGASQPWFAEYERRRIPDNEDEGRKKALELFKREFVADPILGVYSAKDQSLVLRSQLEGSAANWPANVAGHISPFLRADSPAPRTDLRNLYTERGVRFGPIGLVDLSAFAIVHLADAHKPSIDLPPFVVRVDLTLEGTDIERRDRAIGTKLLENIDVRDVLIGVLSGTSGFGWGKKGDSNGGAAQRPRASADELTIESVLEGVAGDKDRTREIQEILAASENRLEIETFRRLWTEIERAFALGGARA